MCIGNGMSKKITKNKKGWEFDSYPFLFLG
ncbi:hypothetical protein J2T37_001403 [Neisseria perflava]|nr:hypothetical protein [Neisseria perflava]